MDHRAQRMQANPGLAAAATEAEARTQAWINAHPRAAKTSTAVPIPVVVHVIYDNANENISTAQIQSQIDVLNEDFGLMNPDSLPTTHPFWGFTANAGIEFCLASLDPSGNPTSGITRTATSVASFNGNGDEKYASSGGHDNWDPTRYLNIWVCDLGASGGTLGYATFPDELAGNPNDDGVVIHFQAFGTMGTAGQGGFDVNNLGRTATHEVGHWLNLFHIWGDNSPFCGDDLVGDTAPCDDANYDCPSFPLDPNNSCGTGSFGEMYMNYMDYVDDNCMNMFTSGQATRMNAALNGDRSAILASGACSIPATFDEGIDFASLQLSPNPSEGEFNLLGKLPVGRACKVFVTNAQGTLVHEGRIQGGVSRKLDLGHLPSGIYLVHLHDGGNVANFKAVILH